MRLNVPLPLIQFSLRLDDNCLEYGVCTPVLWANPRTTVQEYEEWTHAVPLNAIRDRLLKGEINAEAIYQDSGRGSSNPARLTVVYPHGESPR